MQNVYCAQTAKLVGMCFPRQESVASGFATWKTVKIGTHQSVNELRKALEANGNVIGDWANEILSKPAFTVASEQTEIELVQISNFKLGFKEGAHLRDTYKRALELGLELCPNEVGPQLRLQYKDQPKDEWLSIAMCTIATSGDYLGVFYVIDYGGPWLRGGDAHPDRFRDGNNCFVFVRNNGSF